MFGLKEIGRFFPLKDAVSSFEKCLNYLISGCHRGDIF